MEKPKKKVVKLSQHKPIIPITRASTRVATKKVKVVEKPKGKRTFTSIELNQPVKKTYERRKYVAPTKSDEEKTEFDDMSQFKVVSHSPSSDLDNLCENIKSNANFSGFAHIDFDKIGKVEQNNIEEAIYVIMTTFK